MKLKTLRLAGFKTFVDPTILHLRGPLTGVVGPNGCGKSNVVDAVRWVLGESSARQLRGDALADVIFNGSSARQPVGKASVELVFDNSAGTLGGAWASYAEIAVRRELARDGQSVYFLNGSRCRRRDITDIFLGTGLGPRSYAIIEQGMIARLIEARPEELRAFVEEVAGISKYKDRRHETAGRIRHTRDNMSRLDDLRDELGRRLATLERQARSAQTFRELKAEERQLRAQLLAVRLRAQDSAVATQRGALEQGLTAQEQALAGLRAAQAQTEAAREAQAAAGTELGEVQQAWYQAGADLAGREQALTALRDQQARLAQEHARLLASAEQIERQCAQTEARLAELGAAQQDAEHERGRLEQAMAGANAALARAEAVLNEQRRACDAVSTELQQAAERERLQQAHAERLQQHRDRLATQRERLLREQQQLTAAADAAGAEAAPDVPALEAELGSGEQAVHDAQARIAACREELETLGADEALLHGTVREQRGRLASLNTLQQAALAGAEPVQVWLREQGVAARELLAAVDAQPDWRGALEAALGPWLQAQVIDSLDTVALDALSQATGLLLLEAGERSTAASGSLLDAVHSAVDLAALIGGVRRADTPAQALALRHTLAQHESVVTREGIRVGRNWLAVPGNDGAEGVLERGAEIAALQTALAHNETRLTECQHRRTEARQALAAAEQAQAAARQAHTAALRRLAEAQARAAARQAHRERTRQRQQAIAAELAELDTQGRQDAGDLQSADAQRTAAASQRAKARQTLAEYEAQRREAEAAVRSARAERDALAEQSQRLRMRQQAWQTEVTTLQKTLTGWQAQRDGIDERLAVLAAERQAAAEPQAALEQALQACLLARETASQRLAEARDAMAEADNRLRESDQARLSAEQAAHERRAHAQALQLRLAELEARLEALREQAAEHERSPEQLLAELPQDAEEGAIETALAAVLRRIDRLGAINLAAIDEQRELAERKTYLDAQHADLAAALDTMEQAMRRMDRETRSRFRATFDQVNAGFSATFPRLFGGGEARLELLDDNLLEAGIGIVARPPGKRNSSIQLLSGGEKALTAISLVFALFELNPAPFCMLDEVDAPLDDHNVGRFCALVREMSARVQFIVITHNKTTMELAGQLTGVTMSEPGVSRLVAVDVDEAVAMATA